MLQDQPIDPTRCTCQDGLPAIVCPVHSKSAVERMQRMIAIDQAARGTQAERNAACKWLGIGQDEKDSEQPQSKG